MSGKAAVTTRDSVSQTGVKVDPQMFNLMTSSFFQFCRLFQIQIKYKIIIKKKSKMCTQFYFQTPSTRTPLHIST